MTQRWGGRHAEELTRAVLAVSRVCHLCGGAGADTADHLIPRKLGGPDELWNLAPAHRSCNSSRGTLSVEQWRAKYGYARRAQPSPSAAW